MLIVLGEGSSRGKREREVNSKQVRRGERESECVERRWVVKKKERRRESEGGEDVWNEGGGATS
jgi:hypothetical protein